MGFELDLAKRHVAAEGSEAGDFGEGFQQVAARWEERGVAAVAEPGVGEGGFERVAGVVADRGGGGCGEVGGLAPDARVGDFVLVAGRGDPFELGKAALEGFLMAGPRLVGCTGKAGNLPFDVRIAEDGSIEGGGVRGARAGTKRCVGVEGFGAAEEIAEEHVEVNRAIVAASPCTARGYYAGLLTDVEENAKVVGCGVGICGVCGLNKRFYGCVVDSYGVSDITLEVSTTRDDTKSLELVHAGPYSL